MYKVKWDKENNLVLLSDSTDEEITPPRPVFFEELDLLGFDKYWEYPKSEEPLLWNIGRRYYYKGKCVAEAKGGNIFEAPKIKITEEGKNLVLKPIDIDLLIQKNIDAIKTIEGEAIDFINNTYKNYKDKVDAFIVAYSGGKDSQVVLDLVSRTLPPDEYFVIFTDTTMEIPPTYETYEETKKLYQKLYPKLKFYTARNERHSYDLWKVFGPPSRLIRWCCSVYKTSPQIRLLKSLFPDKTNLKVLVFDGVRADESIRRSRYERIAEDVKHINVIDSRIILNWTNLEVFMYIIYRKNLIHINIPINYGYRYGLTRIGCSICPFGSPWTEYIINKLFPEQTLEYISEIRKTAFSLGLENIKDINKYISKGQWKKRGGGKGIDRENGYIILTEFPTLEIILFNNNKKIKENITWLQVLGDTSIYVLNNGNIYEGVIRLQDKTIINYKISFTNNVQCKFYTLNKDKISLLKKILNKITYCINCGVCEVECPNNAINVLPYISIDETKCKHCYSCLDFNSYGCTVAKSLNLPKGDTKMKNTKSTGIDRYSTFGLREGWLVAFFNKKYNWFNDNSLGPKQVNAFIIWLKEAEILDNTFRGKKISKIGESLIELFYKNTQLVWEIILINLFYNSKIINWYLSEIPWKTSYNKHDLFKKLKENYPKLSDGTLMNPLNALINLFENNKYISNVLKIGIIKKEGSNKLVEKIGTDNIHPIAILYSIYRYAISKDRYRLTVSEFYREDNKDGGPYLIFGISRPALENLLRGLQESLTELIKVDIVADLDNIYLSEDIKDYSQILYYVK